MRNALFLPSLALALSVLCTPFAAHASVGTPSNLTVVGGIYTNDTTPTFTWSAVPGATKYDYKLNNNDYKSNGTATSVTLGPLGDGWYTFWLRPAGTNGTWSGPVSVTFEIDTAGPTIGEVTPTTATVGVPTTFSVTPKGDAATTGCTLLVDGVSAGAMTAKSGTYRAAHSFTTSGHHRLAASCEDGDGNTTVGKPQTIDVGQSSQAAEGSVIKSQCAANATASDACHTVYYYGDDGMRHAFPSEGVYKSWYDNFQNVKTVSASFLANLPIGKNVTYRPGSVLVKFFSDAAVFAIDKGARLRHYESASLVTMDYGASWSSLLVTLADILRGNYATGAKIDEAGDYDPQAAWDSVKSIADMF